MEKELMSVIKSLEGDLKTFRSIMKKYNSIIVKKGLAGRAAQVEYHAASLKIAAKSLLKVRTEQI